MRNILTTRVALIAIIGWITVATPHAFGQSAWSTRATDHFDIYYRPQHANQVEPVAMEAERAYARIAADLHHSLAARLVIIMLNGDEVASDEAGAIKNIRQSGAPEGGDHLQLAIEPVEGREGRITHELTHQFEFEMIPNAPQIPSWVYEGLAEYERVRWTAVGAPVLSPSSAIPSVTTMTGADRNWSQVAFAFVGDEFGTEGIRRYLTALKSGGNATQQAFGLSPDQFDQEFARYVRARR